MKPIKLFTSLTAVVLAVVPAPLSAASSGKTIPKYTVIPVILDDTISTRKNKTGDKFQVHCVAPSTGGFPSGTTFVGVLTVSPAQGSKPGSGSARFTTAILPDERKIQIEAMPSTAEGVKKEGQMGKTSKKQAKAKGAMLGAGVGALTDGWRGAVVGGMVGGVAGSAAKGQGLDVELKAGSKGYIVLTKNATIPAPKKK